MFRLTISTIIKQSKYTDICSVYRVCEFVKTAMRCQLAVCQLVQEVHGLWQRFSVPFVPRHTSRMASTCATHFKNGVHIRDTLQEWRPHA